jgi:hypothetical protein
MKIFYARINTWTGPEFDYNDCEVRFYKTREEAEAAETASFFSVMDYDEDWDGTPRVPEVFELDTEDPNCFSSFARDEQIRKEELENFYRVHPELKKD